MMGLSDNQLRAISITERVCSTVSLVSISLVVATFLSQFREPISRLIFYALCGNIFFHIGTLILNARVRRGADSALCQFQTFLLQWYVCRYLCLGSGKPYVEIWNPDLIS
jgi:hypothetical protein